jgi:hypothetical protein
VAALLLALLAPLPACGNARPPGGSGGLHDGTDGRPARLVVRGSPYEMGWWQGHLLRERIRRLHGAWRAELLEAVLAVPGGGAGGRALRTGVDDFCTICVDQTIHRLSERMLQELDGIAAGAGMSREGVVRLAVMREALRMRGLEPGFVGAAGLLAEPGGYEARAWWSGWEAARHGADLLLVQREPQGAPASVVVAWPGSLGGLAGLTASGLGYAAAEAAVSNPRRLGFGAGRPFYVAARHALEEATSAGSLHAEVTGTMGHVLLSFSMPVSEGGNVPAGVEAMAGFEVYAGSEVEWTLDHRSFIAVGPYEAPERPGARALAVLQEDTLVSPAERWLQLERHAAPGSDAPPAGPRVVMRHGPAGGRIELFLPGEEEGVSVLLAP